MKYFYSEKKSSNTTFIFDLFLNTSRTKPPNLILTSF